MRYEFDLARSFMKSTRNKKIYHPHIMLSILGIAIGVSFLIFALSIYDGYVKKIETIVFSFYPQITMQTDTAAEESEMDDNLLLADEEQSDDCQSVCEGNIILEDQTVDRENGSDSQGFDLDSLEALKQKLAGIEGIRKVSPIIFEESEFNCFYPVGQSEFSRKGPLRILGVMPGDIEYTFVPEIERTITDRSLLKKLADPEEDYVILSSELYRKLLSAAPGNHADKIEKIYLKANHQVTATPGKGVPLTVAGVFKLGMHKISENMLITSVRVAQRLFSKPGTATFLGLSLSDPYQAEAITNKIKKATMEDNLQVYHWMAVAADMFNSLSFYRKIVIIVLLMSILITAFNIYTTLNIMILERKKQIGVLVSMGIKKSSLHAIFLIISQKEALIGILSGVFSGVLLGYYFSDYFNRSLQAFVQIQDTGTIVHPETLLFIFAFVCLISGLTAFAATRKGVNLDPVEALRSE